MEEDWVNEPHQVTICVWIFVP